MINKEMRTLTFGDVTYEIVDEKARIEVNKKISNVDKGKPNGVASLDETGKIPNEQLPEIKSYGSEGENSFSANDSCVALGDYSFASGKDTIAGCKGYYIKAIDFTNNKIYLSMEKIAPSEDYIEDEKFEIPNEYYEKGDLFSIEIAHNKIFMASILELSNNVIKYEGDLGFTKLDESGDNYFVVPSKPLVGVDLSENFYASFVTGLNNIANGLCASAEGYNNIAVGDFAHVEGRDNKAGFASHAEGYGTQALGIRSHSEGSNTIAQGAASHTEGAETQAIGLYAHAEGYDSKAEGNASHTEGYCTYANGVNSHCEGRKTRAIGNYSHAEGQGSEDETIGALGLASHVEGFCTTASGSYSHAEGVETEAIGQHSHAEGDSTQAIGAYAHAEGKSSKAKGGASHAEGVETEAIGQHSHAEGFCTTASSLNQHVQGKYNLLDVDESGNATNKYAHIVGNGSSNIRSNAHTLSWEGQGYFAQGTTMTGADYAEFFEWFDGNSNNEDRVGLLVTLDGEKIKLANNEDEVLGIISGTVAVLGDNYECEWNGKYLTDEFGRIIYDMVEEFVEIPHTEIDDEVKVTERVETVSCGFFKHPRINPAYNPEKAYVNRSDRPEWSAVGMFGKLYVRDDGTCQINGYATVGENGIATASSEKTNMRVLSRVNENVIRVLLK